MPDDPRPIRADVTPHGLSLDRDRLARKLALLPTDAPVVALVHGWRYAPGMQGDCPHGTILGLTTDAPARKVVSWPRHLGLDGQRGLAIALGWNARCGAWRAHFRAQAAAQALADLAALVATLAPGRKLQVIAHSMGARVALGAVERAQPGSFARLVLLAAAETRGAAQQALAAPGGRGVQVINVATRENDLFDALFEWGLHLGLHASVGRGLAAPGWHDLWIDHPAARAGLARLGHPLAAPDRRICHWSPYLRPGLFALYRALLDGSLPPDHLPKVVPARRFSRLLAWDPGFAPRGAAEHP